MRTLPKSARLLLAGLALVAVAAIALLVADLSGGSSSPSSAASIRPSGLPSSVSTSMATLMQLSPVPSRQAPNFQLVDQGGRTVSLSALKGRVVVLTFMDSHCTDICPLVSEEFRNAYRDLKQAGRSVVFVAVDVNPYHRTISDVRAFSHLHLLDTIPTWHFVTGSVAELKRVWAAYGIAVDAPSPNVDVIHSSVVYFISKHGEESFVAAPMADHMANGTAYLPARQLVAWGQGIALVAQYLLSH